MTTCLFTCCYLCLGFCGILQRATAPIERQDLDLEVQSGHGQGAGTSSVEFSSDGKLLLTGGGYTACLWEVSSALLIRRFSGHRSDVLTVAFVPERSLVVTGAKDKTIRIWDSGLRSEVRRIQCESWIHDFAITPDGKRVFAQQDDSAVICEWDIDTGRKLRTYQSPFPGDAFSICASSDERLVVAAFVDGLVIWDRSDYAQPRTIRSQETYFTSVALSADGKVVATGSSNGVVHIWELKTGIQLRMLGIHGSHVTDVYWLLAVWCGLA